ncbi:hypothetical protein AKJ56_01190 [candidate division MSBL1 archaeon SCGC-AAA382N08]|uniref:Uncharacterized protein n=1 Tax=candidate division MSBL1 archaeon SCGC-AAA382N08 TaxID=1698285 RepID=A0A133VPY3_9EURY|nr:hypothetical protein AKJ56_01190 [candidate division MSBL1 archaeon SCGC-AAA382N08]
MQGVADGFLLFIGGIVGYFLFDFLKGMESLIINSSIGAFAVLGVILLFVVNQYPSEILWGVSIGITVRSKHIL